MKEFGGIYSQKRVNQIQPSSHLNGSPPRIFKTQYKGNRQGGGSKLSEINERLQSQTDLLKMRSTIRRKIFDSNRSVSGHSSNKSSTIFRGSRYSADHNTNNFTKKTPIQNNNPISNQRDHNHNHGVGQTLKNPIVDRLQHIKNQRQQNRSRSKSQSQSKSKSRSRSNLIIGGYGNSSGPSSRINYLTRNPIISHGTPINFIYGNPASNERQDNQRLRYITPSYGYGGSVNMENQFVRHNTKVQQEQKMGMMQPRNSPSRIGFNQYSSYLTTTSANAVHPLLTTTTNNSNPNQHPHPHQHPHHNKNQTPISQIMKKPIVFRSVDLSAQNHLLKQQSAEDESENHNNREILFDNTQDDDLYGYPPSNMLSTYNPQIGIGSGGMGNGINHSRFNEEGGRGESSYYAKGDVSYGVGVMSGGWNNNDNNNEKNPHNTNNKYGYGQKKYGNQQQQKLQQQLEQQQQQQKVQKFEKNVYYQNSHKIHSTDLLEQQRIRQNNKNNNNNNNNKNNNNNMKSSQHTPSYKISSINNSHINTNSPNGIKNNLDDYSEDENEKLYYFNEEDDDEDRFFDMDIRLSKKKQSHRDHRGNGPRRYGQENVQPSSPFQLNAMPIDNPQNNKNNLTTTTKTMTSKNLMKKVMQILGKVDNQGKMITIVLVGIGVLLVLFQAIR